MKGNYTHTLPFKTALAHDEIVFHEAIQGNNVTDLL
jgi:hypothetical protein